MSKKNFNKIPSYRHHKPSGQAIVTLNGKDFYLGPWKSEISKAEYERLTGEWLTNGRQLVSDTARGGQPKITVSELLAAYWHHVENYYVKDG